jgi:hypothetical protein
MPFVAWAGPAPLERVGEALPEAQTLGTDALVAHDDTALGQDRLNLAPAQAEAVIKPDTTRYDKRATYFLAAVHLASVVIWLN